MLSFFLLIWWGQFAFAQNLSSAVLDRRAELLKELEALEREIGNYQNLVNTKTAEAATLERDIAILTSKISSTKLQIKAIDLSIEALSGQIEDKETAITAIVDKVEREKLSLAELMRKFQEYDDVSMLEIMLSHDRVSQFLEDVDAIDVLQISLQSSTLVLGEAKKLQIAVRDDLVEQKTEKGQLRALQNLAKKQLETNEKIHKDLLKETRGQESQYRKVVLTKKKDAASIRTQLFLLQGSPAIPFERAVDFAERASKKTGVRPAFILGVIAQESELGRNIGQCNLPDDPPKFKWQQIMKPSRDHAAYLDITNRLGLDPNLMPLSCPMSVGWGGAMGPAQFIPSTWRLFENRIAEATGHTPPNPWNPEDAFMASALYLADLGATGEAGERTAAAKYFAGSAWKGSLGRTYATQVLDKVATYQEQLAILGNTASAR
ncbi:MAG: lytic murein transglycosylase [Candidatus Ryanbacteria bacterium]|nr:lytic murein transglycosylase [Candidatus Ryanbacteria bacterium]